MPSNSKVHVKSKGILKKLGRDIGRVKCFKIKVILLNTAILGRGGGGVKKIFCPTI